MQLICEFKGRTFFSQWKKPVPRSIQGTIISFILRCETTAKSFREICLRAKVFGIWSPGIFLKQHYLKKLYYLYAC